MRHRFTARFAAVSKKFPLSGAKTQVKYMNPGTFLLRRYRYILMCFYYVDIGTYWCVFITLLQKRIAAVQNSNIRGLSLKVNALSCPIPNPTLNLPDSVSKCKIDVKTYSFDATMLFKLPYIQIWTVLSNRDYTGFKQELLYLRLRTPWATEQTYRLWKPIDMKLDMCDANV